jgi:hypothetical protein
MEASNVIAFASEHTPGFHQAFLPKELLNGSAVMEMPFRVDRMEYLGSEPILYGDLEGRVAKREVTAKLLAHVAVGGISPGACTPSRSRSDWKFAAMLGDAAGAGVSRARFFGPCH